MPDDGTLPLLQPMSEIAGRMSAVVGAYYADRERRPIGMFGDGSLGMTAGELETLVRLQVPALLILFNNGCFGWIKGLHRLLGHNQCFGVDFLPPKGQAIAEAFGLKAWTVTTPEQLDKYLAEAFAYNGPCFLDIHVESIADRVPPVYSWLSKRGRDPLQFDLEQLALASERLSGAELEQVVTAALYAAFSGSRELADTDLLRAIDETVPIYDTYEERIKELRDWARGRARPASLDAKIVDLFQTT